MTNETQPQSRDSATSEKKKRNGNGASASGGGEAALAQLAEQIRNGRVVLCAGTRLGSSGGFRGLVGSLLDQVPNLSKSEAARVLESRPLAAAGFARRHLGDQFLTELQRRVPTNKPVNETARLLCELPFRAIVTTSYDDTFERAFVRDGKAPEIFTPRNAGSLAKNGRSRFVFKALGDAATADSIVFSAEDLQGALQDGGYRDLAHNLYRSRNFLFVGFEATDPDLAILLERVLAGARTESQEHYAILPGIGAIEREELYAAFRIRVLDLEDAGALAKQLKERVGDLSSPALPDDDDLEGWLALLGEEPDHAVGRERLQALEAKLRQNGDHDRLIELLLGRVDIESESAGRAKRLFEVARVFENDVGDLGKAFHALLAAYKEDPRNGTWTELERLAAATGLWNEMLTELTEIVPQLPEDQRAEAWTRIARLYGERLGHVDYALASVDEALKLAPTSESAHELRVQLLRRTERWRDLCDSLWKLAEQEENASKKAELYVEQGSIFENRLSDAPQALGSYRQALEADPQHAEAQSALETLLRRRGEWKELVSFLDERMSHQGAVEAAITRLEVAEIYADKLNNRREAIRRYELLLEVAPQDLGLLRTLERLYTQEGLHEDCLRVLTAQAGVVESDRERAALYRRIAAEWQEHPGQGAKAAEVLERLLLLDGNSEDAFRELEKIYRNDRNFEKLVDAYRRHAVIVPVTLRAPLFFEVGQVYEHELRDSARALEALREVEALQPNHPEALEALSRLYVRTENYTAAVETLSKRAQLAEVRAQKVELFHEAGEVTVQRLGDSKRAEQLFNRALELAPNYVPSMVALVEIHRKNGEFLKAARLLTEAVPHTKNRLERTRLLVEAGEIFQTLDDNKQATALYLDALAVDPEHVEAGERVSDLLWEAERFTDLVPVLEMLTRREADTHVQLERLMRLARAAQALGEKEKVQKAYARAADLDPTHLEAQRGRAELLVNDQQFAEAREALNSIYQHHNEDLPPSEKVDLYYLTGLCNQKLGREEDAKGWFIRALEIDPKHRPSLLQQMQFGQGQPESVIEAKKALLHTATEEEKVRLLGEIGDLHLEKVQDPHAAVAAYREALELRPDDRKLLHKALDIYCEQKSWPSAIEMLDKLITGERSGPVRAKYRHAAALICRDELGLPERAAQLLTEALEDDASFDRAGQALEELLTARQDWKELARYYRRALKRIGAETGDGKDSERLRLWSGLGQVFLDKLGDRESAVAALEVAIALDRNNVERHKQLADLYVQAGPDRFDKAILEHQQVLRSEKQRVVSYRALKHLYLQTGQRDKAAACSYALTFLKKGEKDDHAVVSELKGKAFASARRGINDETWTRLIHPEEDRVLSMLFGLLSPALLTGQAQTHKQLGLNRKEAIDPADPRPFNRAVRYVAETMALGPIEVYARPGDVQKEGMALSITLDRQTVTPAVLVGQALSDKRSERDIMFEVGRRVSQLRPDRILRFLFAQPQQLAHIIEAGVLVGEDPEKQAASEVVKTAVGLKRVLSPVQLEQVVAIGRRLRASGTSAEALALQWLQLSDLSANRVGLVLAQDLETCARLLASDPASATTVAPTQRLLDLVWSSVTEDVFAVRKHLGLT